VPAAWTVGRRAATAGLACLLLAACTGDRAEGRGKQPPVRPGKAVDLTVPADPALAAGARSRRYLVHVPAGYRPGSPAPAAPSTRRCSWTPAR
jgi:hypothetical protein